MALPSDTTLCSTHLGIDPLRGYDSSDPIHPNTGVGHVTLGRMVRHTLAAR